MNKFLYGASDVLSPFKRTGSIRRSGRRRSIVQEGRERPQSPQTVLATSPVSTPTTRRRSNLEGSDTDNLFSESRENKLTRSQSMTHAKSPHSIEVSRQMNEIQSSDSSIDSNSDRIAARYGRKWKSHIEPRDLRRTNSSPTAPHRRHVNLPTHETVPQPIETSSDPSVSDALISQPVVSSCSNQIVPTRGRTRPNRFQNSTSVDDASQLKETTRVDQAEVNEILENVARKTRKKSLDKQLSDNKCDDAIEYVQDIGKQIVDSLPMTLTQKAMQDFENNKLNAKVAEPNSNTGSQVSGYSTRSRSSNNSGFISNKSSTDTLTNVSMDSLKDDAVVKRQSIPDPLCNREKRYGKVYDTPDYSSSSASLNETAPLPPSSINNDIGYRSLSRSNHRQLTSSLRNSMVCPDLERTVNYLNTSTSHREPRGLSMLSERYSQPQTYQQPHHPYYSNSSLNSESNGLSESVDSLSDDSRSKYAAAYIRHFPPKSGSIQDQHPQCISPTIDDKDEGFETESAASSISQRNSMCDQDLLDESCKTETSVDIARSCESIAANPKLTVTEFPSDLSKSVDPHRKPTTTSTVTKSHGVLNSEPQRKTSLNTINKLSNVMKPSSPRRTAVDLTSIKCKPSKTSKPAAPSNNALVPPVNVHPTKSPQIERKINKAALDVTTRLSKPKSLRTTRSTTNTTTAPHTTTKPTARVAPSSKPSPSNHMHNDESINTNHSNVSPFRRGVGGRQTLPPSLLSKNKRAAAIARDVPEPPKRTSSMRVPYKYALNLQHNTPSKPVNNPSSDNTKTTTKSTDYLKPNKQSVWDRLGQSKSYSPTRTSSYTTDRTGRMATVLKCK